MLGVVSDTHDHSADGHELVQGGRRLILRPEGTFQSGAKLGNVESILPAFLEILQPMTFC